MKPARCPVCNGAGVVRSEDSTGTVISVTCHGCPGGRGWVEVSEVDECVIVPPKEASGIWPTEEETEPEGSGEEKKEDGE